MSRTLVRTLSTLGSTLLLLVLTALPALAAGAATKPHHDDTYLLGSMEQLITTAIVGLVVGGLVFALSPRTTAGDDNH